MGRVLARARRTSLMESGVNKVVQTCVFIVALASGGGAVAQQPGRVFSFGDSSSDGGVVYSNLDGAGQGLSFLPTPRQLRPVNGGGRIWVESVAQFFGRAMTPARRITQIVDEGAVREAFLQDDFETIAALVTNPAETIERTGGANYALSGATALDWRGDGRGAFAEQIDWFREDGRRFEHNDLVFVLFDSNDPAEALTRGEPYDPGAYANAYADGVAQLQALGARNIVAMGDTLATLSPDEYLIASFALLAGGEEEAAVALAQHKQDMLDSRAALWPLLSEAGVYIVNLDKVAADINADPQRYGFTRGATAVQPAEEVGGDSGGYVFIHDGHYTSAAQDIFADYTIAELRARDQFGHLLTRPMRALHEETVAVDARIGLDAFARPGEQGARASGKWRTYGDVFHDSVRNRGAGGSDDGFNARSAGGSLGGDVSVADGVILGGRLFYAKEDGDFRADTGEYAREDALATLYGAARLGENAFASLSLSYGRLDYDHVARRAGLGPTTAVSSGDTGGDFRSLRFGVGYRLNAGDWSATLGNTWTYERVEIDGFDEGAGVLGVSFGSSSLEALRGGLSVKAALSGGDHAMRPFLGVAIDHDFKDEEVSVRIGPNRDTLAPYVFERPNRTIGRVEAGLSFAPVERVSVLAGVSASKALEGVEATNLTGRIETILRF